MSSVSAAVIGRQLRQHTTTGRTSTSGPLYPLPQVSSKTRSRSPSRPGRSSPYTAGSFDPGGGGGRYDYGSSHRKTGSRKQQSKDRNKEDEPRLKCTWHCFCVAFKALSGGLILLIAGTVMSVIGFVADANHNSTLVLSNDTVIEQPLPTVFRNLTFAGPVMMGLGGIVIVAALVLTFEVRDTLGVKVPPTSKPVPGPSVETNGKQSSLSLTRSISATRKKPSTIDESGDDKISIIAASSISPASQSAPPSSDRFAKKFSFKSGYSRTHATEASKCERPKHSSSSSSSRHKPTSDGRLSYSKLDPERLTMDVSTDYPVNPFIVDHHQCSSEPITGHSLDNFDLQRKSTSSGASDKIKYKRPTSLVTIKPLNSSLSGTTSSIPLTPNHLESYYFSLASPQDIQLSDVDGVSLIVPKSYRTARCSCSASPIGSIAGNLNIQLDKPNNYWRCSLWCLQENILQKSPKLRETLIREQQFILQKQLEQLQRLLDQTQSQKSIDGDKYLASMESDGLSIKSSSSLLEDDEDDLFLPLSKLPNSEAKSAPNLPINCSEQLNKQDLLKDNLKHKSKRKLIKNAIKDD